MINNILYKSDILNGIFTKEDFNFLKESNSKQEEIEYLIKLAKLKKNKIAEKIKSVDAIRKKDENELNNEEKAWDGINKIINNLTNIFNEFNDIEKNIIELIVKKESNARIDIEQITNNLNKRIYNFKTEQKRIESENKEYYTYVNKFLFETDDSAVVPDQVQEKIIKKEVNKGKKVFNEIKDNLKLVVSERTKKVYLPYTKNEVQEFLNNYPDEYETAEDVIEKEFITDISIYNKHPVLARFREAYCLSRYKEMKSAIDSLKFAMDIMFKREINPTIIAAVKSENQLSSYIECLEKKNMESFKYFTITFEVNPI